MKLSKIIELTNTLIDDELPPEMITGWVNDGMAQINVELNANFPFLSLNTDDEPVFPEKWQRLLLVIFAASRAKQQDSSQFEYEDFYNQFMVNLSDFKSKYTVPDDYADEDNSSVTPDYSFSFWSGNGWS